MSHPQEFPGVTAVVKANIYFEGKVVSHTLRFQDGSKKTLGVIFPGTYRFDTGAPERMEIVAGACRVRFAGGIDVSSHGAGSRFEVPGKSSFEIAVDAGICEYICTFLST